MEFSEESKRAAKDFFKRFDYNGDGTLQKKQLMDALYAFGCDLDNKGIKFVRDQFDTDGDGDVQIDELIEYLDVLIQHSVDGEKLLEAFKTFDLNGDGLISSRELVQVLTAEGPNSMSKEDAKALVQEMLEKYDTNHDKKFSYAEFVRMIIGTDMDSPNRQIDNIVYNNKK